MSSIYLTIADIANISKKTITASEIRQKNKFQLESQSQNYKAIIKDTTAKDTTAKDN